MVRGILITWTIVAALVAIGLGVFVIRHELFAGGMLIALSLTVIGMAVALVLPASQSHVQVPKKGGDNIARQSARTARKRIRDSAIPAT